LELPILPPVVAGQVEKFQPYPSRDFIGGFVTLTNGYKFRYEQGYVGLFYAPSNFNNFPSDWRIPEEGYKFTNFFGTMNMTTNEVIQFARSTLAKLGYDPKNMSADGPPVSFEGPHELFGGLIPYCEVEWRSSSKSPPSDHDLVRIGIDAGARRVVYLSIISTNARRPDPKLNVDPSVEKPKAAKMFVRTNAPAHPPRE
jgi:hypothetical protein